MSRLPKITALTLALVALAWMARTEPAWAHDPQDEILKQVGVDEKLGQPIPTGLRFTDQTGKTVELSRYFTGKPVILTLNYYSCPTLCSLVLRNLVGTVGRLKNLELGRDFRIVTVSIDPEEKLERAADRAARTYTMLGGPADAGSAWPFLIGEHGSIEQLAQRVGVRYARSGKEYAHPNVIIIVTPDGRVSRYLYGLEQEPQDLKLALIEAADGNIGTSKLLNRALLYCFHYDPVGKKYVLLASRVLTGAMAGVLLVTLGLLAVLWKREKTSKGEKHA